MTKRIRHAAHEFVRAEYADRYARKGWLERNFNIAGQWYLWRKNIETPGGIFRFGVTDKHNAFEGELP